MNKDSSLFNIAGKTVLLTGASGGIGSAMMDVFRTHGLEVIASDIAPPKGGLPDGVRFEQLDVTDTVAVDKMAAGIEKVDCVIHCAGKLIRWEEYKPEVFQSIVDIHLVGNLRLANAFQPHLKAAGGCLVNIASMYSFFGAHRLPAYAAAKAGVVSLTKSLAIRFAEDGIRVNAIAPGWIKTEINAKARAEDTDFMAQVCARIPNGEWAEPEDLAGTAMFLMSSAAKLVNGATIPVDGGYSIN